MLTRSLRMGTGYLGDLIVIRLARRNKGYKEPEMRLWTLILSFIYGGVGYFSYGWTAQAGSSWVGIAIGLCAMIAQQVSATSIATTYAMECFEGLSNVEVKRVIFILTLCSSDFWRAGRRACYLLLVHQLRHVIQRTTFD